MVNDICYLALIKGERGKVGRVTKRRVQVCWSVGFKENIGSIGNTLTFPFSHCRRRRLPMSDDWRTTAKDEAAIAAAVAEGRITVCEPALGFYYPPVAADDAAGMRGDGNLAAHYRTFTLLERVPVPSAAER